MVQYMCNGSGGSEIGLRQVDGVVMIKQAFPVISLPMAHLVWDLDMYCTGSVKHVGSHMQQKGGGWNCGTYNVLDKVD